MKGANRMAAVAAIIAAGVFTIAQARSGNAMSSGLIGGSRAVAHGAERVVMAIGHAVAGLFQGEEAGSARVSVEVGARKAGHGRSATSRGAVPCLRGSSSRSRA